METLPRKPGGESSQLTSWIDNIAVLFDLRLTVSVSTKINPSRKQILYEVKCLMCEDIYIGNTQQIFKKIMDGHFWSPVTSQKRTK